LLLKKFVKISFLEVVLSVYGVSMLDSIEFKLLLPHHTSL